MEYIVKRLDGSMRDDFYRFHSVRNGFGWCFCTAWWLPTWEGWNKRTDGQNRVLREKIFDYHDYDGYLLYAGDEPVGWCQCAPRDWFEKLRIEYRLEEDPDAWAMTCFCIAPGYRERHLADFMVEEILQDLKSRNVRCLEGFPKRGKDLGPGEVWTGPEAVFIRAGFSLVQDDQRFPVYRKYLQDLPG